MTKPNRRQPLVILVMVLCLAAVGGLFVAVLRHSWRISADDADIVRLERQGVVYMHPLTTLVGELVEAQSAAVRGETPDTSALTKALDGVARADGTVGASLQTRARFAELRGRVEAAMQRSSDPRAAYFTYSD